MDASMIRILLIDDDEDDALLTRELLEDGCMRSLGELVPTNRFLG